MFDAGSVSTISTTDVPSTPLVERVVSTPTTSLPTSSPSSQRTSVLAESSVPAFTRDSLLGKAGETLTVQQLGEKSSVLVQEFVYNSVAPGTLKIYPYTWDLFRSYGKLSGVDVDKYSFDFLSSLSCFIREICNLIPVEDSFFP